MDQFQQNQPTPEFNQNPTNNPTTGPQFELVERGGWGRRIREWLNKYGSSVILPLIALIILASGIYLYATQKRQENNILLQEDNTATVTLSDELSEPGSEAENEGIVSDEQIIGAITEPQLVTEPVEPEAIKEIIPEKRQDNTDVIVEKAEKGEGVTHLARKALKNYINDKTQSLTKEQKIYIEDYLKDKIGSKGLEIGEEIEFSKDLINEAIDSATKLTPEQLKVIEKYSALVVSL